MSHRLTAGDDAHLVAEAATVLVCYDYAAARSVPVPDEWRAKFQAAEGRSLDRATQGVA
jgi:acyl-CoA thioesterase FadM